MKKKKDFFIEKIETKFFKKLIQKKSPKKDRIKNVNVKIKSEKSKIRGQNSWFFCP